ncbi:hypothetical protein BDN67DRAFT_963001 [Paxillus ammoniavirescens]|nr:hypothetical protein BDN67DRAFT_963001 [Paxillus ammoniavirescens]
MRSPMRKQSILLLDLTAVTQPERKDTCECDAHQQHLRHMFASTFAMITPFLFDSSAMWITYVVGASIATWKAGSLTLVLAMSTKSVRP